MDHSIPTHFLGMLDNDKEKEKKISSQPTFMLHCDCKSTAPYSPSHMGMSLLLLELFPLQLLGRYSSSEKTNQFQISSSETTKATSVFDF